MTLASKIKADRPVYYDVTMSLADDNWCHIELIKLVTERKEDVKKITIVF